MLSSYKSLLDLMNAFPTEKSCIEHLEKLRWPKGIVCPLCASTRKFHKITRGNIYKCADCEKSFSVRKGTIFEDSHINLAIWLQAIVLLCSSKKGMSAHQLHRQLGITYKSAWFMAHRIRYAMDQNSFKKMQGTIEADETYVNEIYKHLYYTEHGSIGGKLDALNLHGATKMITIYPNYAPAITCDIDDNLIPIIEKALLKKVTVTGKLKTRIGDKYPSEIIVEDIKIHKSKEDIPLVSNLWGMLTSAS